MLNTGAMEPSHTFAAQVDVTCARKSGTVEYRPGHPLAFTASVRFRDGNDVAARVKNPAGRNKAATGVSEDDA